MQKVSEAERRCQESEDRLNNIKQKQKKDREERANSSLKLPPNLAKLLYETAKRQKCACRVLYDENGQKHELISIGEKKFIYVETEALADEIKSHATTQHFPIMLGFNSEKGKVHMGIDIYEENDELTNAERDHAANLLLLHQALGEADKEKQAAKQEARWALMTPEEVEAEKKEIQKVIEERNKKREDAERKNREDMIALHQAYQKKQENMTAEEVEAEQKVIEERKKKNEVLAIYWFYRRLLEGSYQQVIKLKEEEQKEKDAALRKTQLTEEEQKTLSSENHDENNLITNQQNFQNGNHAVDSSSDQKHQTVEGNMTNDSSNDDSSNDDSANVHSSASDQEKKNTDSLTNSIANSTQQKNSSPSRFNHFNDESTKFLLFTGEHLSYAITTSQFNKMQNANSKMSDSEVDANNSLKEPEKTKPYIQSFTVNSNCNNNCNNNSNDDNFNANASVQPATATGSVPEKTNSDIQSSASDANGLGVKTNKHPWYASTSKDTRKSNRLGRLNFFN